jgi:predicted histidine transporter YuiF (NhaC family)
MRCIILCNTYNLFIFFFLQSTFENKFQLKLLTKEINSNSVSLKIHLIVCLYLLFASRYIIYIIFENVIKSAQKKKILWKKSKKKNKGSFPIQLFRFSIQMCITFFFSVVSFVVCILIKLKNSNYIWKDLFNEFSR